MPGWRPLPREEADALASALARGAWAPGGRYAKRERDDYTWLGALRTASGQRPVALKRIAHKAGAFARIAIALRGTRARRQCVGAYRLDRKGIAVARPLMLLRGVQDGRTCDWLVLERIPGDDLINVLARNELGVRAMHAAAAEAGALARRITRAFLLNRDHKLSNLILTPSGSLVVVDTVTVQRRKRRVHRLLAAMMYEAMGTRTLPRRAVLMRCVRAATDDPKRMWRRLERMAREAGDTTPRVDPVGRRTKGQMAKGQMAK